MKHAYQSTANFCDNESNNDRSMHLIHCTGTSTASKDCCVDTHKVTRAHTEKLQGSPLLLCFLSCTSFEECKTSPPSNNADNTSLFSAEPNKQYGRDNIRISRVEEINDEDKYEPMVEVASDIGGTLSKQDITVCNSLPSRDPGSRPTIAKFVRSEAQFLLLTHEGNLEKSTKKI